MEDFDQDTANLHRLAVRKQLMEAIQYVWIAPLPFFVNSSWTLLVVVFIIWLPLAALTDHWMLSQQSPNAKKALREYIDSYSRMPRVLAFLVVMTAFGIWIMSITGDAPPPLHATFLGFALGSLFQAIWIARHPQVRS